MFGKLLSLKNDWFSLLIAIIAFSLSFERFPSFEAFGMTVRVSTVAGILLIFSTGALPLKDKTVFGRLPKGLVSILAIWLIWVGAGLIRADDLRSGLKLYVPLVFFVLLSVSIAAVLNKKRLLVSLWALLSGAAFAALFGLFQLIGNRFGLPSHLTGIRPEYSWERFGFPRIHSGALEPLYFSNFLLLPISILAVLLMKKYLKLSWPIAGLLGLLCVVDVLTVSRGGLAALVVLVLVLVMLLIRRRDLRHLSPKQLLFGFLGILLVITLSVGTIGILAKQGSDSDLTYGKKGIGTFLSHLQNTRLSPSDSNKTKDDSVNQRSSARDQAINTLGDYPVVLFFGVGIGQYDSFSQKHRTGGYFMSNNLTLEQLLQTGLIGLGLLVSFGLILLWRLVDCMRNCKSIEGYLSGALVAYFVAVFFQAQSFSGIGLTHLWFSIGLSLFLVQLHQIGSSKNVKEKNKEKISP